MDTVTFTPQRLRDVARGEALRLVTLRRPMFFAALAVAVAVGFAAIATVLAQAVSSIGAAYSEDGESLLQGAATSGMMSLALFCGVIAIDVTASEHANGGAHLTALATPRRSRIFTTRLAIAQVFGCATGWIALLLCTVAVTGISSVAGVSDPWAAGGLSFARVMGVPIAVFLVVCFAHGLVHAVPHALWAYTILFGVFSIAPVVIRSLGGTDATSAMHAVLLALPSEHLGALASGALTPASVLVPIVWSAGALLAGCVRFVRASHR
jgi:hypothetical protein